MMKTGWFPGMLLFMTIPLSYLLGVTLSSIEIEENTIYIHDTIIYNDSMGDGCFYNGEFLPNSVAYND